MNIENFLMELDQILYTLALEHMPEDEAADVTKRIRQALRTIEFPEE